ncbi:MAG: zinc ribbon domain-containing protein [Clostridia bacterium]|nr:zinc ribbon domain-containing protein [Clostridia bacterium]
MDFWDDVYKKVSDAANYTAKETGRLSELAKVKYNLMREKAKLEDAYKEMGELYYNQMKTSEYDDKKIALAYDKIEKSITEIERLSTQVNVINNTKICKKCGEKLTKEMVYCPKCGDEFKAEQEEAKEATGTTTEE